MGRVLFVACTNVGRAMIETICCNPKISSEVVGIVNLNTQQALKKANYQSYTDVEEKYQIPLHFCNNVNDAETMEWIAQKKPDIIIQTGWSQKFKKPLLHLPRFGCIGEHPAPLPRGRGAACVNWAILTGETHWGDSFFRMVDEYDRGEVYAQAFFEIKEYDDVKTVYDKVANCAKSIVAEHIDNWSNGEYSSIPLDEAQATYYKRRTPENGLFDFHMPAKQLYDFIRAQTEPYPGAFFMLRGKKITVLSANLVKGKYAEATGAVLGETEAGGLRVVCGDRGAIDLLRYRREDGALIWFAEDMQLREMSNFLDFSNCGEEEVVCTKD